MIWWCMIYMIWLEWLVWRRSGPLWCSVHLRTIFANSPLSQTRGFQSYPRLAGVVLPHTRYRHELHSFQYAWPYMGIQLACRSINIACHQKQMLTEVVLAENLADVFGVVDKNFRAGRGLILEESRTSLPYWPTHYCWHELLITRISILGYK